MRKMVIGLLSAACLLLLACAYSPAVAAAPQEPTRFLLEFKDAYIVYILNGGSLQLTAVGNVLSYGADWEVVQLKPFLYEMRLKTWKGFFWKVNTSRKQIFEVRGGTFGQMGGTDKLLPYTLDVTGGSNDNPPERFVIRFPQAHMVHLPRTGAVQVVASGTVLSYGEAWEAAKLKPYLFHLRLSTWREFFWKINTDRKEAYRVREGTFGQIGGTDTKLDIVVKVVNPS